MSHIENISEDNSQIFNSQALPENSLFSAEFYKKLIEELKDEALAWRISYELGGGRIYVPKYIKPNNVWFKFGKAFCDWLSFNYGGEQIIIPLGPASELKKRSMQAINMAERGYSANQIVKMLGYSYRSAQYKKAIAKENTQLRLFEQENF